MLTNVDSTLILNKPALPHKEISNGFYKFTIETKKGWAIAHPEYYSKLELTQDFFSCFHNVIDSETKFLHHNAAWSRSTKTIDCN